MPENILDFIHENTSYIRLFSRVCFDYYDDKLPWYRGVPVYYAPNIEVKQWSHVDQ